MWRFAVDTGGTFTDLVLVNEDGHLLRKKVLSTPTDYSAGILDGLHGLLEAHGVAVAEIEEVVHATTVATNAILEHRGARTALVTTQGFRDVLEIRRLSMPEVYNLRYQKPSPLVPRRARLEVTERIDGAGTVVAPLDPESLESVIDRIRGEEFEAVGISLINSYINDEHELCIETAIKDAIPDCHISRSSEILPQIEEYRRTSTTVVNAYIAPVVTRYLRMLAEKLRNAGFRCPVFVMQSNGGVMGIERAQRLPVAIVESGPAAGVVGGARLGGEIGAQDSITFDMGGTTAKASLIENGEVAQAREYEVGSGINLGNRLDRGGGYLLGVPSIEVAEVGAGGGSIAWIDPAGVLHVGPTSAGAFPGPACYGLGGTKPTVTDANLLLGYLGSEGLAGGDIPIDVDAAREAFDREIAKPLGLTIEEAAFGVHRISNANMQKAIQAVSTERGRDPSEFSMIAFGGSGPVHAASLAATLDIRTVVIPPAAGLFSSLGLLFTDLTHRFSRTLLRKVGDLTSQDLTDALVELERQSLRVLADEGCEASNLVIEMSADVRYFGQHYELEIALPRNGDSLVDLGKLESDFLDAYHRLYGHHGDSADLEVVTLRVVARTRIGKAKAWPQVPADTAQGARAPRPVYFGADIGWIETPVSTRAQLKESGTEGPMIIEEYDSTTVVPHGWRVALGAQGEIVMRAEST